jgi:phosphoglycolate phosphatase-like HAD superfamily hydrolase
VESYIRHLRGQIDNDRKRLKPGVRDLLDMLSVRPDCRIGLLTGNLEEGARIKLGAFGLNRYFSLGGSQTPSGSQAPSGSRTPLNVGSQAPLNSGIKTNIDNSEGKGGHVPGKRDNVPLKSANKVYIEKPHGKVDHVPLYGAPGVGGLKAAFNLKASNDQKEGDCVPEEGDCVPEEGDCVHEERDYVPEEGGCAPVPREGDCVPEERDCVPFGAFGSDDEDRNRLLPIAVEKFRALTGMEVGYADCIVIGDTPRDVLCAKPYGAISLAVATGGYSMEELRAAGADMVMEDLRGGYCYLERVI